MHSVPSHSASKPHDSDYSRNRARSIRFLILLAAILALAFFLSLRAGSYNTPAAELHGEIYAVKGAGNVRFCTVILFQVNRL